MKKSKTAKALKNNLKELTSTSTSAKKSKGSLTRKTRTTKAKTSTAIKIIQSRKKDMFPMMNMYKFPYLFEPMPEIADRLNKAWFDEHYGEERMKEHIRKHKLKSHQYKCYVNYWWLKDQRKS